MARLFITERELNFISDLTKEIIKDVGGQTIVYYPISELKTKTHDVYNEAVQKIFDNPIRIDALVDASYQNETKIGKFGIDNQYKLEVFIQYRDLVDKNINVCIGDFISYSDVFFEISDVVVLKNIFGHAEHSDGIKMTCIKSREGQFKALLSGPTDIKYTDDSAVQKTFVQQRGFTENSQGVTGDVRSLVEAGVLEEPLTGPKEVSERGATADNSHHGTSFYDEGE